jgi:hypothetical protein
MTAADDQTADRTGDESSARGARITVDNATGEELPEELRTLLDAVAAYPYRQFPAPSDDEDETTRVEREAHEAICGLLDDCGDVEVTVFTLSPLR